MEALRYFKETNRKDHVIYFRLYEMSRKDQNDCLGLVRDRARGGGEMTASFRGDDNLKLLV
jgi:hypothetical protein